MRNSHQTSSAKGYWHAIRSKRCNPHRLIRGDKGITLKIAATFVHDDYAITMCLAHKVQSAQRKASAQLLTVFDLLKITAESRGKESS
jgi:hypothetical protein